MDGEDRNSSSKLERSIGKGDHSMTKKLILILGYVFIDVLGFSLILPLLPFYAESFEASPTIVGLLLGANAITQLIGAPTIGRLSDRYGRRPLLLISISGTVLSFVLLGLANSLVAPGNPGRHQGLCWGGVW